MRDDLHVCQGDEPLARLIDAGDGYAALEYLPGLVRERPGQVVVSVRLPVRAERYSGVEVMPFLDGELPEEDARRRICEELRLAETDLFGLLSAIGRDCAGALSYVPEAELEAAVEPAVRWLTDDELVDQINRLPDHPLGNDPERGVRISLAGAQEKLVLVRDEGTGRFGLPLGSRPSTHILKPERLLRDGTAAYPGFVENELFCLRVAISGGLDAASASLGEAGPFRYLLVERFDRRRVDGLVHRVHQEDCCQALGLRSTEKYEGLRSRGPTAAAIASLLGSYSALALVDRPAFLDRLVLAYILGDCDLHAKNISLAIEDGAVRLAPIYDLISTCAYPHVNRELALHIGGEPLIDAVTPERWQDELSRCKMRSRAMERRLAGTAERTLAAIDDELAVASDEGWHHPILDEISTAAATRAEAVLALR